MSVLTNPVTCITLSLYLLNQVHRFERRYKRWAPLPQRFFYAQNMSIIFGGRMGKPSGLPDPFAGRSTRYVRRPMFERISGGLLIYQKEPIMHSLFNTLAAVLPLRQKLTVLFFHTRYIDLKKQLRVSLGGLL